MSATQQFRYGRMFWIEESGDIWVLTDSGQGHKFTEAVYNSWPDNDEGNGALAPRYGFGKVWRNQANIRIALGTATHAEEKITLSVRVVFGETYLIQLDQPVIKISADGTWAKDDAPAPPVIVEPPVDPGLYITVADHKLAMDALRTEMLAMMDATMKAHIAASLTIDEVADNLVVRRKAEPIASATSQTLLKPLKPLKAG